jgi:Fic family protein
MKDVEEFLKESNAIEGVYDEDSLQQALFAWNYLINEDEMSAHTILKTHKILMLHQPLHPDERGYFRKVPVYIGGKEARNWKVIPTEIANWCKKMNIQIADISSRKEHRSKLLHVEYEKIHPFVDGNGRTGRMFMNWWRLKNKLPLLIIHEGQEQLDYYKWFK